MTFLWTLRSWRDNFCPFLWSRMVYLFNTDLREHLKGWECDWDSKLTQASTFGDRSIIFFPSFLPILQLLQKPFLLLMQFLVHSENCFCFQSALFSWFLSVLMVLSSSQFQFSFWGNFAFPVTRVRATITNYLYVFQNIIQVHHFVLVLCNDNKSEFSSLFSSSSYSLQND